MIAITVEEALKELNEYNLEDWIQEIVLANHLKNLGE